jgi:mannose-6-phosphate isomerase
VDVYRPPVHDFVLARIEGGGSFALSGPAVVLCTEGFATLQGQGSSVPVGRGESFYVTPDEAKISLLGTATIFVATTG